MTHRLITLVFFLCSSTLLAQTSTFDMDNEGWTASGDPVSQVSDWYPTGGNPDGHIEVQDASTGGTWYFVAPPKFRGNKCDAYGKFLRYDQLTSDTNNQQAYGGRPDIRILGGSLTLIFDNAYNPGLEWTHYDVPLREDAGWRLNSITGPVPTQAQFRNVLASVTAFEIRGEYRSSADIGGLDNVTIESKFDFDLDDDDSSGAQESDFRADTTCSATSPVADMDAILFVETRIDSIVVRILFSNAGAEEALEWSTLPLAVSIKQTGALRYTLVNTGGTASSADFITAIHALIYHDRSLRPQRGVRTVQFQIFVECGAAGSAYAYVPMFPQPNAGLDGDSTLCAGTAATSLLSILGNSPDPGGFWSPKPITASNLFDPAQDSPGLYAYIIPPVGTCPGDTALVRIAVERSVQLPADTTICNNDVLTLAVPSGLLSWQWSTGSHQPQISITSPGTYALSGQTAHCTFADSITVDFYTCKACDFYVPNVFSPNDDGHNDEWQVFAPCLWSRWRLELYDRWGSLVFAADDPEAFWDGRIRGKDAVPGVYLWRLEWVGELLGVPKMYRAEGDVTVVR